MEFVTKENFSWIRVLYRAPSGTLETTWFQGFFAASKRVLPFILDAFTLFFLRIWYISDTTSNQAGYEFESALKQVLSIFCSKLLHLVGTWDSAQCGADLLRRFFFGFIAHRFQYWLYRQNAMHCFFGWVCHNKCGLHTWKFYKIHTDTLQKPCYTVRKIESTIVSRRCVMWRRLCFA